MSEEETKQFFRTLHSRLDEIEKRIDEQPQAASRTLRGGFTRFIKKQG